MLIRKISYIKCVCITGIKVCDILKYGICVDGYSKIRNQIKVCTHGINAGRTHEINAGH